eukprot:19390-Amphidinium_carterae.1
MREVGNAVALASTASTSREVCGNVKKYFAVSAASQQKRSRTQRGVAPRAARSENGTETPDYV